MNPREFHWEVELRKRKKSFGSQSEDEVAELYEFISEAIDIEEREKCKPVQS